ncbi:MAG TPA: GntR family transcriptional regulator [Solirubrobacteraceae bacterium]|nr:GntR family transcriptional regulator [Solirubrobacteraceae bacterium]
MTLEDLTPLQREPVSAAVHRRLRAAILRGDVAPGEALPSERALSDAFAVNRHAVREAIKRLQQARLVEVAQGGATRVLDWRRTGGIELLLDVASARPEQPDRDVVRAILEFRAAIGADVARRCAQRAPAAERARAAAMAQEVLDGRLEPDARLERYEELWQVVVDGAANLGYRLAYNTLLDGQHLVAPAAALVAPEMDDGARLRALAGALLDADPERAHAAARALLEPAAEAA